MTQIRRPEDFYRYVNDLEKRVKALERLNRGKPLIQDGIFPENPYDGEEIYWSSDDLNIPIEHYRWNEIAQNWQSLGGGEIPDAAVTLAKLAANSVDASKIVDGSVGSAELATGSVTSAKIADGTIADADLASNAVTTAKIQDGAVTSAKIADGTIAEADMSSGNPIVYGAGKRKLRGFITAIGTLPSGWNNAIDVNYGFTSPTVEVVLVNLGSNANYHMELEVVAWGTSSVRVNINNLSGSVDSNGDQMFGPPTNYTGVTLNGLVLGT